MIKANKAPWFTVNFDSATGLLNALACSLHGRGFPGVGHVPESELLADLVNALPWKFKKYIYLNGNSKKAITPDTLANVNAEVFSAWACDQYPKQKYPAILVGSSSGPAIHLAAAMGVPWLPQTFLIPVQTPKSLSVDDPVSRMEWARSPAVTLLNANPNLQLHHMMDPNQDRPMLEAVSYFRVKQRGLDACYRKFISEHLADNGTIIVINCQKHWQTTQVDERHFFQFGGMGGTPPDDYFNDNAIVKQFLKDAGANVKAWEAPRADIVMPEAEWGFEQFMMKDLKDLAYEKGFELLEVAFDDPEDLSPYIANLYRWWYAQQGVSSTRLVVGTFFLVEPFLTLDSLSIPYWLCFNAKCSVDTLKAYLASAAPFDYIYLMPFSHGVKGPGLATIEDYTAMLKFAQKKGEFIGSDTALYPFDFGIYFRYDKDLRKKLVPGLRPNSKFRIENLKTFHAQHPEKSKVRLQAIQ